MFDATNTRSRSRNSLGKVKWKSKLFWQSYSVSCECDPNRNLGLITSLPPKLAFLDRIVTELNGILRFRTLYLILQQRPNKCSICIHPLNLGPCHMVYQLGYVEHLVTYKGLPQPEFSWDGLHRPWIPENVNDHVGKLLQIIFKGFTNEAQTWAG